MAKSVPTRNVNSYVMVTGIASATGALCACSNFATPTKGKANMAKQAKATAPAAPAAPATTYALSATGVALAAKHGNNTRQTVTAPATTPTGATVWRNTKTGKQAAPNTRAAACAAVAAVAPCTAAVALQALAPLQASGALGAGSTASGYWAWLVRVGHVVAA